MNVSRLVANLNVLRVERQSTSDIRSRAFRSTAFEKTINRILELADKNPNVTIDDLFRAKVGGARMMSYILEIHSSDADLPEVRNLMQQSSSFRSAYNSHHRMHHSEIETIQLELEHYKRVVHWMVLRVLRTCERLVAPICAWFKHEYQTLVYDSNVALHANSSCN